MVTDSNSLKQSNLHEVLIPRVRMLRAYLFRRVPASLKQTLAVDDILQEVWLAAYQSVHRFRPTGPDSVDHWLMTIAHSRLVDAVRHARRIKRGGDRRFVRDVTPNLTSFSSLFARLRAVQRTPSSDAHLIETAHAMQMAMSRLSDRQRQAVQLRFLQGLSRREIATRMSTTEKAVKELVHRGLHAMRDMLGSATKYFTDTRSVDALTALESAGAPV